MQAASPYDAQRMGEPPILDDEDPEIASLLARYMEVKGSAWGSSAIAHAHQSGRVDRRAHLAVQGLGIQQVGQRDARALAKRRAHARPMPSATPVTM